MDKSLERDIQRELLAWKSSTRRKPLVLTGARQTGKTFALKQFGREHFRQYHLINFQENPAFNTIFDGDLAPSAILRALELLLNVDIDVEKDLLILDEIQDCPRAVTSVKYFCEQSPELALCCAGSLLGVTHTQSPFPVGKVTFLDLRPLSFREFLMALDEVRAQEYIDNVMLGSKIPEALHDSFMSLLREYLVVGGLPAVVTLYKELRDDRRQAFEQVRQEQGDLLSAYVRDFAKYGENVQAKRILSVFESVPAQLSKDNKKFVPSKVVSGGRYSNLESAIDWLTGAGLCIKVPIANSAELPFSAFTADNRFKLYFFDVGLLGALAQLSPSAIYLESDIFATFKGALCENVVAQELLVTHGKALYSWMNNTSEVEFIYELDNQVVPIEVKSGLSGKLKSLNVFDKKYGSPFRVRISARNFEINTESNMHSYPLYLSYRFPMNA